MTFLFQGIILNQCVLYCTIPCDLWWYTWSIWKHWLNFVQSWEWKFYKTTSKTIVIICSLQYENLHVQFFNLFSSLAGLQPFGNVAEQLLKDVQERLVFRAHLYFKTDILQFHPSPGDLAYPEKLEMMKVLMNFPSNSLFKLESFIVEHVF